MRYQFLGELEEKIEDILSYKDKVLISVIGEGGTGKSFFGKYIRKHGIGRFHRRSIAVIDDRLMKLDFLFLFQRIIRVPPHGIDELQPFIKKMPGRKKIIFYINATPEQRITRTDIILKLWTDEDTRKIRLQKRYGHDKTEIIQKMMKSQNVGSHDLNHVHYLEAKV